MVTTFGYERRAILLDLLVLAAVPALLVGLHVFLPAADRIALALDHADPTLGSFLTAAYVHANDVHVLYNVVGYVAGVVMAYLLCLQAGRRRWFHATLAASLVAVPVAVNAASVWAPATPYGGPAAMTSGFSAVVAAVGGVVYVALLSLLAATYPLAVTTFAGAFVLLVLTTTFYLVQVGAADAVLLAMLGGSGALCLAALVTAAPGGVPRDLEGWRRLAGETVPVALVTALLVAFVVGLFPRDVVRDGLVINVYAHGIGFVLGAVLAAGLAVLVPAERTPNGG